MIFTIAPPWFIILCLILAAAYAVGLYLRERKTEIPALVRSALAAVRFVAVFIIAFLLLSPFIKSVAHLKEKPIVIIAQDNSGSLAMTADSDFYRSEYLKELDNLSASLESKYDVQRYTFGESVTSLPQGQEFLNKVNYKQKLTNLSDLFTSISGIYSNSNLGALILSTDGIYNAGFNPVYQVTDISCPIYVITLGDTAQRRDIILSHVAYNRLVYLNDKYPLQVTVVAHDCKGAETTLKVTEGNKTLFSQQINIDQTDFTTTVNVLLEANESGLKHYRVYLSGIEGELSRENNAKDIFIDVLNDRNKILILYHSPHPDVAALRQMAEANMNYEVDDSPATDFKGHLEAYNLVVLHQLPAKGEPATALLKEIRDKEIPVLFILGTQSDLARVNQWETGLKIVSSRQLYEEALPVYNPDFGLFTVDDDTRRLLNSFPPLTVPSGDYQQGSMGNALVYQRIGSVQTSRPMILLGQNLQYRAGIISGEGIWRWRMMNYSLAGNQDAFNDLFNKIFQYLSLKEQKKNLRIYNKSSFPEYERVQFDAELYNRNYELINNPELDMVITDDQGKEYPFTFSKSLNAYKLDAGRFAPGNYTYRAQVKVGEEMFTASGQFSVSRIDLESLDLVADHNLLSSLASESSGKVYQPPQLDELKSDILENPDIKPLIYSTKRITELINFPWLMVSIVVLLALEWFVRKRSGSY